MNDSDDDRIQVSPGQLSEATAALNNSKAPDASGLIVEHLKNTGPLMTTTISQVLNVILENKRISARLMLGIVTPIWKNEKYKSSNYRGIIDISTYR